MRTTPPTPALADPPEATHLPLSLDPVQRRVVAVTWATYAAYYLGRVNLSTALPGMQSDLGLTAAQAGLLGTLFFWVYAIGQPINGRLGDRLSPRKFIAVGLVGSGILNLAFGFSEHWGLLLALWAVNGYLQAIGWGPTLRLLANWLSPRQRGRIATAFGTSFVAGNALTWLLTGWLAGQYGWRSAFWVPALLMFVFAAGLALLRDVPSDVRASRMQPAEAAPTSPPNAPALHRAQWFWPALVTALLTGICYAALLLWMPTWLVQEVKLSIGVASTLAALLPVTGIAATLAAGWGNARLGSGREGLAAAGVLALVALFFACAPLAADIPVVTIALLLLAGGMANAATSIVLSAWPLALGNGSSTSRVAGILGFAFSAGAGISGSLSGLVLDRGGWAPLFGLLAALALMATVLALLLHTRRTPSTGGHDRGA